MKNPFELLITSIRENNFLISKFIIEKYKIDVQSQNNIAILEAAQYGNIAIIQLLADHGANVKIQNNLLLKQACDKNNLLLIEILIYYGADVGILIHNKKYKNILNYLQMKGVVCLIL